MSEKSFEFNYSAKDRAEIQKIREKYLPREEYEDKLARLRRLDESVGQKASIAALVSGILGALILGGGMSLCMVWGMYLIGIPVGIVGAVGVAAAYPLYQQIVRKERERIAPEILQLSEELMQ